jgi:dTDP-4-amino-4,6-dideoxygalactose transaminase
MPHIPEDCTSNYHMFYLLLDSRHTRDRLLEYLREREIHAVFHYVPLHASPMGAKFGYQAGQLPVTEDVSGRLLRLPFYHDIAKADQAAVVNAVGQFFRAIAAPEPTAGIGSLSTELAPVT